MADAYRLKADTTFHHPIRFAEELADGTEVFEVNPVSYNAGDYLLASELSKRDQERAANGDLDHLLEPVSVQEVEEARSVDESNVYVPEHEVERYILKDAGHTVVERDQLVELKAAGAENAREAIELAKSDGRDERPGITEQESFVEVPSLADVSRGDEELVAPKNSEKVSEEKLAGVEQPPGLPIGKTLEGAAKSPEADDKPRRGRPRSRPGSQSQPEQGQGGEQS